MGRIAVKFAATGWAMSAALLLGGCQVYLHDEALQKQTAAAVAAYKEADVPGAMKATIAAQEKFDEQMLNSIVAEDAAARDLEIARLLESGERGELRKLIDDRLQLVGGPRSTSEESNWSDGLTSMDLLRTQLADNARVVNLMARLYREAGGKAFKECKKDLQLHVDGESTQLKGAADDLKNACDAWIPIAESLELRNDLRVCETKPDSLLAESCRQLSEVDKRITDDEAKAKVTRAGLDKAKQDLADEIAKGTPEEGLKTQLEALQAALEKADAFVEEFGAADFKPSTALASIEFRETNLCDVLLAGVGTSCSGGKVDDNAKKLNEAMVGLIAGTYKLAGPPPETDSLSIALAYQSGLQGAVQASRDGQIAQRTLLKTHQRALVQEVEYLLEARRWLDDPDAKLIRATCASNALLVAPSAKGCTERVAFANALTAYNLAWASGRTAARIANARVTMQITKTNLQVAQATAASRDSMLTTALAGLDAFGQGGVSTQTIAELLQALGIAAVAYGVN